MSTADPFLPGATVPTEATTPPDFSEIAKDLLAGVIDSPSADWLAKTISEGLRSALVAPLGFLIKEITDIIGYFVETYLQAAEAGDTEVSKLAALVVGHLLGQTVDASAFAGVAGSDKRAELAKTLGRK